MSALPDSAYPHCLVCGTTIVSTSRALYEITGYEREREQGGTNHVIARERTGRMVGPCCAERVRLGVDAGQQSFLVTDG
jgi:hypothetical protein